MAIQGVICDLGVTKCRDAANNEGFYIYPIKFSVSNVQSDLDPTRTTANSGVWYEAPISSRVVVSTNTVKFICTIPPALIIPNPTEYIKEIYIYGEDSLNVPFLFAIGQPSTTLIYDPSGSVNLDLDISLTNADLSSIIVFQYTQATELSEHVIDPNSHPDIIAEMNRAGLFPETGSVPFMYRGQEFDKRPQFQGTYASAIRGGVTFRADYTGPDYNGLVITFDGIKTTDQILIDFNTQYPNNPIQHDDLTGSLVLSAGSINLAGGTISVSQNDLVYKDLDGFYKKALADGTIRNKVVGFADITRRLVHSSGFFNITTGLPIGNDLYLSDVTPGGLKGTPTAVKVGTVLGTSQILMSAIGGPTGLLTQNYDAVVSSSPGFNYFPTTQQAVNHVSSGGRILIEKNEYLSSQINTLNKNLQITFSDRNAGWIKSPGFTEQMRINFTSIPDSGTWRIEWNSQETSDLPYNANAAAVQAAMNGLTGHSGCTVTGNYSVGFTIIFSDLAPLPLPTFSFPGQNEIQRFNFSAVPDNGTIRFHYTTEDTAYIAWNDSNAQIEAYFEALTSIDNILLGGGFSSQYLQFEFIGNDSLTPKPAITINFNTLEKTSIPVTANFVQVQEGIYPASNLKTSSLPVTITVTELQTGSPLGPATAIQLTSNNCKIIGLGTIENFEVGVDLNGYLGSVVQAKFVNTTIPVKAVGLVPAIDYSTDGSFGIEDVESPQLKLIEHPTNKRRVILSGCNFQLVNGSQTTQEIRNFAVDFGGAVIDFETGDIYEIDGITPLGINFTPATIANTKYRYYSITALPKTVTSSNTMTLQLLILPASSDGNTISTAPKAVFTNGIKIGQVAVLGTLTGISDILSTYFIQLGTGSGSASGGSGTSFNPYILEESGLEYNLGTLTWSNAINIINQFYGRYTIAPSTLSGIASGDLLYAFTYKPQTLTSNGTINGQVTVTDASYFNDNDDVIIGDANSLKAIGKVYGTPIGNTIIIDDGFTNLVDLSDFTVDQGSWIIKSNTTLLKGQANVGDLKPDSFGNINENIYFVGNCLGDTLFLVNGKEFKRTWIYDESYYSYTAKSFNDPFILPVDSRNGNVARYYEVGTGELEVFINGVKLSNSKVLLTNISAPFTYNSFDGLVTLPIGVTLNNVGKGCTLVDSLNNEYPIQGGVDLINRTLYLETGLSLSVATGAKIIKYDYEEETSVTFSNQIFIKRSLSANFGIISFRISPREGNGSGSGLNTASNLGSGVGVFSTLLGNDLKFRSILAGAGIDVTLTGNDILISLLNKLPQPYFVNYSNNNAGSSINVGNLFNPETNKLEVYRNGVHLVNSSLMSDSIDKFQETSNDKISLGISSLPTDLFTFVNDDTAPSYLTYINGISSTVLDVPSYLMGTNRLKVYRNGLLMNSSSLGSSVDQYTETSTTSITLALASSVSDVFTIHYLGIAPDFRQDLTGLTGSSITVNTYTMGNKKLLVYRNGVLMVNSLTLGDSVDRYQETTSTSITLSTSAISSDVFTFINKA